MKQIDVQIELERVNRQNIILMEYIEILKQKIELLEKELTSMKKK